MPLNFNLATTLAGRAPALLRHGRRVPRALPSRSFSSVSPLSASASCRVSIASARPANSKRLGTLKVMRAYSSTAVQDAPNPKAYLDSGVIKPHQTVDVKKVLVIGSGGLAIGQAGEFDYSG
jgi:carbamoyl-phosphate synthase large subunit